MGFSKIKVVEKGTRKQVFIDEVEQKNVAKVETEILPGELTWVKVSYYTDQFEAIREPVEFDEFSRPGGNLND